MSTLHLGLEEIAVAESKISSVKNTSYNKNGLKVDLVYFLNLLDHYLTANPYENLEYFIQQASLAAYSFPDYIKELLMNFKTYGNEDGYLLFRSFPYDRSLMNTPVNIEEVREKKKTFYSEFWLAAIARFLGEPFSYIQENKGNIFHNVRPTYNNKDMLSSESSTILLDFHTETAFHPYTPDFLSLFCLRSDRHKEAQTIISSIRYFQDDIDAELERILRKPLFKTGIDYSFGSVNGMRGNGPTIPILYGDSRDLLITFDPDLMRGLTDEAEMAIKTLKKIIDKHKRAVVLEEGDLIIIDNRRALHGRTYFKANFDGQDRWLQRLYISRDLTRANILFSKSERIITYKFDREISCVSNSSI
ncbi:MAG: hypothetical protein EPO11_10925 [Gammaproteobacteria bacterium]|nr:MAG: hypothetical protein EPO11_10925 [Gammaproteobacteria bacterium]